MAYPATHHYTLRSGRQEELYVPVEIQTSDDVNFLMDLLARQRASISGQVDSDASLSESDCEALIEKFGSRTKFCSFPV